MFDRVLLCARVAADVGGGNQIVHEAVEVRKYNEIEEKKLFLTCFSLLCMAATQSIPLFLSFRFLREWT